MPLCVKRPIPELSVPPLRGAVWLEAVRRELAVVEQDVGHVAADGQGHAWATTAYHHRAAKKGKPGLKFQGSWQPLLVKNIL